MKLMKTSHNNTNKYSMLTTALFIGVSLILPLIESSTSINYGMRSLIKSVLFISIPLLMSRIDVSVSIQDFLRFQKETLYKSFMLGILIYISIVVGFTLIQPLLSLDTIKASLLSNVSVDKENFLYVALYITFINSWIEEFFFRGFGYFSIKHKTSRKKSMFLSSLLFALYHISIVRDWAHPILVGLSIVGLFFVGIFFILLNESNQSIYPSWIVHMFANLAINTIGLHMFGFIHLPFLL